MAKASSKIGNILKDEGNEYVDEVSTQQNIDNLHVRTPRDVKIDRDDGGPPETQVKYLKKKIGRSTPYLDHEAGLLFPVSELEKAPPNSIIHQIGGREESSILGGFIFGNGREELKFPFKDKTDLRLQLADGFCIYKKKSDFLYIQLLDTKFDEIPTQDNEKIHIYMDKEGNIKINKEQDCYIEIDKDKNITIQKDANNQIIIDKDGNIDIKSQDKTTITVGGDAILDATGKVDIDSAGEITLDGVSVKLQGGGNKLSHADHKHGYNHMHTTGNIGMPVPFKPVVDHIGAGQDTDQHLPIQGTTTTEAE